MAIIKAFNGKTELEVSSSLSVGIRLDWDMITPALKKLISIREDETLDGFIVTDVGIMFKLSRKRVRRKKEQEITGTDNPIDFTDFTPPV